MSSLLHIFSWKQNKRFLRLGKNCFVQIIFSLALAGILFFRSTTRVFRGCFLSSFYLNLFKSDHLSRGPYLIHYFNCFLFIMVAPLFLCMQYLNEEMLPHVFRVFVSSVKHTCESLYPLPCSFEMTVSY